MDPESNGNLQEEVKETNPDDYIASNNDQHELVIELNNRMERERQLLNILQDKERDARNLTRTYNDLKAKMLKNQSEARQKPVDMEVDPNILKELNLLKEKIRDKENRLDLLEKELDDFNRSRGDQDGHFHARSKGADELLNYQKLATENPFLETHIRTEFYKSSLDTVQALKQLAEHLMFEIEKATSIKAELETDKALFDSYLKKLRNEYKQIQDENEKLVNEADRRS